jgi:hypothetical protein
MRTATLPAVRVAPELRARVEANLRPGETLSTYIEQVVEEHTRWREEDAAFIARAIDASKRLDAGGKFFTAEQSIARLRAQIQRARAKQSEPTAKTKTAKVVGASTPKSTPKKPAPRKSRAAA